jgi:hypothetical protein
MRYGAVISGVLAFAVTAGAPAFALDREIFEEKCGSSPFAPSIPTDPSIPDAKVAEIKADVLTFIKESDRFQECIERTMAEGPKVKKDMTREQVEAAQNRLDRLGVTMINGNQAEKERIGNAFNALIDLRIAKAQMKPAASAKPEVAKPEASLQIPTAPAGMLPSARPTAAAKSVEKPAGL